MNPQNVLKVDADRLWAAIDRSAQIGRFRDTGLRRLALSPEDKEMRDLFVAGCGRPAARSKWILSATSSHAAPAAIPVCRLWPSAAISTRRSAAGVTMAYWGSCVGWR